VKLPRWSRNTRLTEDAHSSRVDLCKTILEFLSVLAPVDVLQDPLQVDISGNMAVRFAQTAEEGADRPEAQLLKSINFKIPCIDILFGNKKDVATLMSLQPVVYFDEDIELAPHEDYECLLKRLRPCFSSEHRPTYPGRLFLSGLPATVLSPEELEATRDAEADTLLKLYNDIKTDSQPTWEEFTSTIKLVEPGFWPSRDDLEAGRRSV
jgi:hypothetical protein